MKTQRRRDNGGSAPPPSHDDYDDYEDGLSSAEESLAVTNGNGHDYSPDVADESALPEEEIVPSPARSATNGSSAAKADGHSNGSGVSSSPRVRPPASSLPKRRPRPGDGAQAASVVDVPELPATQAPANGNGHANGNGNGKSKNRNGITNGAMSATAVAPARSSRNIPPPPTPASTPASEAVASAPPETLPSRVFRLFVTYETLIFFTIFALAIFTRFWDLGDRGIHHDESLHSVYSRNLYIGLGYTHDPMMHGPIQFNLIAFMYWLFGTSDTTARFASATCGVWVVMSPFFLRRQMGRWPALIASFLLLIAPGVLYFSRMAREDSVFSAMEMIMIVGLWRFISTRRPADFFIFCAGLSLMFTIKETAYLSVAIVGSLFAILFALQAGYAVLGALAAYGVAMGGLLLYVSGGMKSGAIAALPSIPAQNPDYTTIMTFASNLLSHPIVQGAVLITLVFVGLIVGLLSIRRESLGRIIATWAIVLAVLRIGIAFIISESLASVIIEIVAMLAALGIGAGFGYLITRGGQIHSASAVFDYDATAPRSSIAGRSARPTRPASTVSSTSAGVPRRRSRVLDAELADDVVTTPVVTGPALEPAVPVSNGNGVPALAYASVADTEASEVYDPKRLDPKPGTLLAHYEPGSLPYLIGSLFSRPSVLVIGFTIAATIFIVLYTVFFTDVPRGIASGLFASLGYWMAQQGVARGGQPWYYYLLIVPLYQPIAVFFSLASGVFFAVKGIRGFLRNREERIYSEQEQPRLGLFNTDRPVPFARFSVLLPLFLVWWLAGAFFIYSWAGEKMPWLMMHITRPAILLASLFLGALLASIIRRRQERVAWEAQYATSYGAPTIPMSERRVAPGGRAQAAGARNQAARAPQYAVRTTPQPVLTEQEPPWVSWNRPTSLFPVVSFMMIITVLALSWGLKLNALTSTGVGSSNYTGWWVSWLYPIAVLVVLVAYSIWLGPGRVFRYLGVAIFSILFLYEFRSATNLVYQHPDVPTELAVYVQTSPSTTSAVAALNEYSDFATGGTNLKVVYDSFTSWPFEWYLRDYKNKKFIGGTAAPDDAGTDTSAAVMFLEYAKVNDSIVSSKVNDSQKQVSDAQAQIATLNAEPQSADRDNKLATAQSQLSAAQTTLTNWGSFQRNYILQRYAMRWWFPEDWYKNDLINGATTTSSIPAQAAAIVNTTAQTFTTPQMSATLWNYLIFRQLPKPLGSEDMVVAIRKDIAQTYHYLQYQPPNTTDEPPGDVQNPPIESSDPSPK